MATLAFFTFGLLKDVAETPRAQEFIDHLPSVFHAADVAAGLVDRRGHPVHRRVDDDGNDDRFGPYVVPSHFDPALAPRIYQSLSFWSSLEAVWAYAYGGEHGEALRHRREWFEPTDWPSYTAWWVADDALPSNAEAVNRASHLFEHGPTPYAFDFRTAFTADGQPYQLDRKRALEGRLPLPGSEPDPMRKRGNVLGKER